MERITYSEREEYNKLVNNLTTSPLNKLLKRYRSRVYKKGQILIYAGDQLPHVYVLKSGVVKLYDIDEEGNEKIIHLISPPAVFPSAVFIGDTRPAQTFYTTLTDCELYLIPTESLETELKADGELSLALMRWFGAEMREIMLRLAGLERASTTDKLKVTLSFLARHHAKLDKRSGWYSVDFPVSHQMLADLVGVTRESATLAVSQLQKDNLIRSPRQARLDISQQLVQPRSYRRPS